MTEELSIKIGTKDEAFWTEVLENSEKDIENLNKLLKFQLAIKKMAETYILAEQEE
jgi:hypothetical protein